MGKYKILEELDTEHASELSPELSEHSLFNKEEMAYLGSVEKDGQLCDYFQLLKENNNISFVYIPRE